MKKPPPLGIKYQPMTGKEVGLLCNQHEEELGQAERDYQEIRVKDAKAYRDKINHVKQEHSAMAAELEEVRKENLKLEIRMAKLTQVKWKAQEDIITALLPAVEFYLWLIESQGHIGMEIKAHETAKSALRELEGK